MTEKEFQKIKDLKTQMRNLVIYMATESDFEKRNELYYKYMKIDERLYDYMLEIRD